MPKPSHSFLKNLTPRQRILSFIAIVSLLFSGVALGLISHHARSHCSIEFAGLSLKCQGEESRLCELTSAITMTLAITTNSSEIYRLTEEHTVQCAWSPTAAGIGITSSILPMAVFVLFLASLKYGKNSPILLRSTIVFVILTLAASLISTVLQAIDLKEGHDFASLYSDLMIALYGNVQVSYHQGPYIAHVVFLDLVFILNIVFLVILIRSAGQHLQSIPQETEGDGPQPVPVPVQGSLEINPRREMQVPTAPPLMIENVMPVIQEVKGRSKQVFYCTTCQAAYQTQLKYRVGAGGWIWIVSCLFFCPCASFGPCCANDCKDVIHECPGCHRELGRDRWLF